MEQLINEAELAKKLGKGRRTVQRWRLTGKGPPYHRIGGQIRGSGLAGPASAGCHGSGRIDMVHARARQGRAGQGLAGHGQPPA
jgi:hypothetical protein